MNIIFAGTPEIAAGVLEELVTAKYKILACLTQADRPQGRGLKLTPSAVKICAQKHNIPVLQPKTLKKNSVQRELQALKPDLMLVMAYGLILPAAVLNIPRLGCINLHASILPRWRGAAPIQHAILAGDLETGITIMQMDQGLDTGNMLAKYTCPILPTDTTKDLHDRLAALARTSIIDFLPSLIQGNINPEQQNNNNATYAEKIEKQDAKINWQASAADISRAIRAYNPWPVAFTNLTDQSIRIWQATSIVDNTAVIKKTPGTILQVNKQGIDVATADGIIRILALQFPGKRMMRVADIYHANNSLMPGAIFE